MKMYSRLESLKQQHRKEIEELEIRLDRVKREYLCSLNAKDAEHRIVLKKCEEEACEMKKYANGCETMIQDLESEKKDLVQKIEHTYQKQIMNYQHAIRERDDQVDSLQEIQASHVHELLCLREKLESSRQESAALQNCLINHKETRYKAHQNAMNVLRSEHMELQSGYTCTIEKLQTECKMLQKRLCQHETIPKSHQQTMEALRREHKQEILKLRRSHTLIIGKLKENYEGLVSRIAKEKRAHDQAINHLKKDHEKYRLEELRRMQTKNNELQAKCREDVRKSEYMNAKFVMEARQETSLIAQELEIQYAAARSKDEDYSQELSAIVSSHENAISLLKIDHEKQLKEQQSRHERDLSHLQMLIRGVPVAATLCHEMTVDSSECIVDEYGSVIAHDVEIEPPPRLSHGTHHCQVKISFVVKFKSFSLAQFGHEQQRNMEHEVARNLCMHDETVAVKHLNRWKHHVRFEVTGYDSVQNAEKAVLIIGSRVPLNLEFYGECVFEQQPTVEEHPSTNALIRIIYASRRQVLVMLRRVNQSKLLVIGLLFVLASYLLHIVLRWLEQWSHTRVTF